MWWNILVTLLVATGTVTSQRDCSKNEYDRCVRIADPLVKEAHLVFPDNLNDIDLVCRTWNMFVDCLKDYTDSCFTDQQRRQFNRAVESPIESVHQMCMQPRYQKEYLQYAPCIKSTIVERTHCGPHYNLLVDQVEQGEVISKSTLCCSHDRFKQCVLRETRRLCDRGVSEGPASRFASQIIEKALRFLQEQCINYIPNSGDCTTPHDSVISYSDRSDPTSVISTPSSSEVYPWSTARDVPSSRVPKFSTPSTWSSSSSSAPSSVDTDSSGSIFPTQHLGTRTRPASYGRSNGWSSEPPYSSSTKPSISTSPAFRGVSSAPEDKLASAPSWDVYGYRSNKLDGNGVSAPPSYRPTDERSTTTTAQYNPLWNPPPRVSTEETWYLAAGNQLNDHVEEPNQLGLKNPRSSGFASRAGVISHAWVVLIVLRTLIK